MCLRIPTHADRRHKGASIPVTVVQRPSAQQSGPEPKGPTPLCGWGGEAGDGSRTEKTWDEARHHRHPHGFEWVGPWRAGAGPGGSRRLGFKEVELGGHPGPGVVAGRSQQAIQAI